MVKTGTDRTWLELPMALESNDRWEGSLPLTENARYQYTIVAITDYYGSWVEEIEKKRAAGLDLSSEIQEGLAILERVASKSAQKRREIRGHAKLARASLSQKEAVEILLNPDLRAAIIEALPRKWGTRYPKVLDIVVDRAAARFASWYELFPRSAGTTKGQSGTFDDVIDRLEEIEWMGFDVIYFPPIHPIGEVNRKGPNNTLNPLPGDPGCPYAIGSAEGGHDAVEPSLGTLQDFRRLVEAARRHGLEIALDFAVQAAPDHPWSTSHPNWFYVRPDGTIKYAENPPKKYEDIYSLNFGSDDWAELWQELRRILLFWIDQGVTTFRVDNPHTKPISFWRWIIREIQDVHPEVIFLSEAFTRPKVMKALAKAGFTQSYTYFTWRNFKQEILEYFTELTNPPVSDYMRGNLFPNTPDILPKILQEGGRPAFKIRGTLAATLSSVYGIYSGFELCEATAIEGKEEYVNSEKYELKVWDWDRPGNIKDYIALINNVRRRHPALQEYDNLKFYWSDNDNILCYGKSLPSQADYILIVLNLDPYLAHESMIHFPVEDFGLSAGEQYEAHDLISNARYFWTGGSQYVRLDPHAEPAHIFAIRHWNRVDYVESGA